MTKISFADKTQVASYDAAKNNAQDVNEIKNSVNALYSTAKTGTALTFATDGVYGTSGSPETGNITGDVTGAVLGVVVILIHNNGSAPTFDAKFKKLSGSGDYATGSLNYIMCQYLDSTHIIYSINQAS